MLVPVPVIIADVPEPAPGHQGRALVRGEKPPAHAGSAGVTGEDGRALVLRQWRSPTHLLRSGWQNGPNVQLRAWLHRDPPPNLVQHQVLLQRTQHRTVTLQEEGGSLVSVLRVPAGGTVALLVMVIPL